MKQIIIISSIFLTLSVSAQEIKMGEAILTCESGTVQAIKDFEKGEYKVYLFGLVIQTEDHGFGGFYKNYVFKTYGIKLIDKGCVVMADEECYSNKMKELLHKKYGKDVFDVARADARTKFDKAKH